MQDFYAGIKCKQRLVLFSEHPDTYTAIRILHTEPGLIWKDNIVPFLCPALSFGAPKMPSLSMMHCQGKSVRELTSHAASNVDAPYEWKLGMLQACLFPDYWSFMWFYGFAGRPHNMSVLSDISHGQALRSCAPFSMPSATHWFHIRMTVDLCRSVRRPISSNDNVHYR